MWYSVSVCVCVCVCVCVVGTSRKARPVSGRDVLYVCTVQVCMYMYIEQGFDAAARLPYLIGCGCSSAAAMQGSWRARLATSGVGLSRLAGCGWQPLHIRLVRGVVVQH